MKHLKITQIRNATIQIKYAGKTFLVDPMLAEKGAYDPFPMSVRQEQKNPLADLPMSIEDIIDVDAVIVTHLHLDHWDEVAANALPKTMPLFVQNEEDEAILKEQGFTNITVLTEITSFEGIQLIKTVGEHGRGEILKMAGLVCGVVFKHASEKTLYVAGDTVWYEGVEQTLTTHTPEVIVVNAGDNQFLQGGSLVMNEQDVLAVANKLSNATVIAVHMEAVNHWNLSRADLRTFAKEHNIDTQVIVPNDGESIER